MEIQKAHTAVFKKVHALVRTDVLKRVEERLQDMHIKNISVTHVKDYGDHDEFFAFRAYIRFARIEIFVEEAQAEAVAAVIVETAHTGMPGDGLVAILPVDKIIRIRSKTEISPEEV